jgi:hypothetical protein
MPSTQVWIPSTDAQPYKTLHLNVDDYAAVRPEQDGRYKSPSWTIGPTVGISPYQVVQAETGFDLIKAGNGFDASPLYFHAKLAAPENILHDYSPALAIGGYNFGTRADKTNQDIFYGLAAKTLPLVGRLSAGYYVGNGRVLVDQTGAKANDGVLLSWDRTMREISDKLWAAVDYMGGRSSLGAFSVGPAWKFSPKASILVGYNFWNDQAVAGRNTMNVQVDLDYP